MDNSQLLQIAQEISPLITPFIPYLLKGAKTLGKGAIERLGEKFSEEGWEKAKKLWGKVFPKGIKDKDTGERLKEYTSVENQAQKEMLISYELEKALKGLSAQDIASIFHLISETKNETTISKASGDGSISIIGNIDNSTITTNEFPSLNIKKPYVSHNYIIDNLEETLKDNGFSTQRNIVVENSTPDLYIISPKGITSAIEVKTWPGTIEYQKRAQKIAETIANTSGSVNAFVVMPGDFSSNYDNVTSVIDFPNVINKFDKESTFSIKKTRKANIKDIPKKFLFSAMPFSQEFDDTFLVAIKQASLNSNFDAIRVDYESYSGDIVEKIKELIKKSTGVIADLSNSKPNVLFEIGYAQGLGKKVIQICSTPLGNLPFDVRNDRTILYKIGQSSLLTNKLEEEIKIVLPN